MMIDGITILDTTSVWVCDNIVFEILVIASFCVAIFLFLSFLSGDDTILPLIIFIILLFSAFIAYKSFRESVSEYKVTISDTASFKDIYGKYEIINQEGDLYTIRERIAKDS